MDVYSMFVVPKRDTNLLTSRSYQLPHIDCLLNVNSRLVMQSWNESITTNTKLIS